MLKSLKDKIFARAVARHRSTVPTSISPIRKIGSAVVFIDGAEQDSRECASEVTRYFENHGIKLHLFALVPSKISEKIPGAVPVRPSDLNWSGLVRRSKKSPVIPKDTDMFVSLLYPEPAAVAYEARVSRAFFKAGRARLDDEVYDLVVSEPDWETRTGRESFASLVEMLGKIC